MNNSVIYKSKKGSISIPECPEEIINFEGLVKHIDVKYELAVLKNKIRYDNTISQKMFSKWVLSYFNESRNTNKSIVLIVAVIDVLIDLELIKVYNDVIIELSWRDNERAYT